MNSAARSGPFVLAVAAVAYLFAVSQRSTLGSAALAASTKFHITGEQLSLLAVAQLAVYAFLQIPVGVLLDRFGSRALLVFGALTMSGGQLLVAYAETFEMAAFGRLAVGFGDAFTFISIIRLINGWYEGSQASRLQQWVGNFGQLGQILSAFPFAALLHLTSWNTAFSTWAVISTISAVAVWFIVRNEKVVHGSSNTKISLTNSFKQLGVNLKSPSVRLAFWIHFVIQSPGTVMVLLWGFPFLVGAQGLSRDQAASLMSLFVVVGIVFGLIYGQIAAHKPQWRKNLVLVLFSLVTVSWVLVLCFPGKAPFWALFALFFVLGISGPGSMMAFDFTKAAVPKSRLGSANGFVNIGGFLASFSIIFLIGLLLDLYHAQNVTQQLYSIGAFRFALPIQFVVLAIGLIMFLLEYSKVLKQKR